jgi:uncharacterized protein (TIGR01319 family)
MSTLALADFGSTYTKITLVDGQNRRVVGQAQAPTSVETDVMEGFHQALAEAGGGDPGISVSETIAASSAAGGLRVAAVGLVSDLTAAAAKQAALNAGARVDVVLAGRFSAEDVRGLEQKAPEIILFAGGTTGGQRKLVLANAHVLAEVETRARFVVACNGEIAEEVARIFGDAGKETEIVDNVMPAMLELNVEPARAAIARLFVEHVIGGKGLSRDPSFGEMVKMPTPEAVLRATRLLSSGAGGVAGRGDVAVVDIGGATTDVHSVADGREPGSWVTAPILPILPILRTVQGDLGVRWNAVGVAEADGEWLCDELDVTSVQLDELSRRRAEDPGQIYRDRSEREADRALAVSCLTVALHRHCGEMVTFFRPNDTPRFAQSGPDLRDVRLIVGTGGVVARDSDGVATIRRALARRRERALVPRAPSIVLDRAYLLSAAGLLAERDPALAAELMRAGLEDGARGEMTSAPATRD